MYNGEAAFTTLDLGSANPISVPMETIETEVSGAMFKEYASAFVKEAWRKNPLRAEQIGLTEQEMLDYTEYLMFKRIECVNNNCKDFRKLKALYIPAWIQHCLTLIGEVIIRDKGIKIVPVMNGECRLKFEEAARISDKVGMLIDDLQIVRDAMPRVPEGNQDVMTTALIADYMRSIEKVTHPAFTYVSAFLGLKLKEETMWASLYRVQYDDFAYIASALTATRGLY